MKTELAVITGMSGSGKSVALHALEDAGYYCVDNLPPELLHPLILLKDGASQKLAIAIDIRSTKALSRLPLLLRALEINNIWLRQIFLDASDQTLVRRFSETRRRHPLSQAEDGHARQALMEAIARERELLQALREHSHVIDTSELRPPQLHGYVTDLVTARSPQLTLVFESFAFKRGITLDADYVFDARMLPNPHYDPALRDLTGQDAPVIAYLEQQPEVARLLRQITEFLEAWLPALARDHRSYVTVAVGCTGGQHRSVYLVEKLTAAFRAEWPTLTRHRELGRQHPKNGAGRVDANDRT